MSDPYEEVLSGDMTLRLAPGPRHELVLGRLQAAIQACMANCPSATLLEPRAQIKVTQNTAMRPDLALVTSANQRLLLVVEVVSSDDHRTDTVTKKQIYEEIKVPRLWMVDPRFDNVEVYHHSEYGLKLITILAGKEVLEEKLLPQFRMVITELFAGVAPES